MLLLLLKGSAAAAERANRRIFATTSTGRYVATGQVYVAGAVATATVSVPSSRVNPDQSTVGDA